MHPAWFSPAPVGKGEALERVVKTVGKDRKTIGNSRPENVSERDEDAGRALDQCRAEGPGLL